MVLSAYLSQLILNISKSFVFSGQPRTTLSDMQNTTIRDIPVETVTSVRYLGIILDSNLSWKKHITSMYKKLTMHFQKCIQTAFNKVRLLFVICVYIYIGTLLFLCMDTG